MKLKKLITCFFTVILFAQLALSQTAVDKLDRYVEKARKDWNVPGLSIAVVQDDKVVFSKGYGIRELDKPETVNSKTLFGAMSTTKAMAVVTLAMLVDEGKLNWDDKVIKHLPAFKVADPYITKEIRVRDLLTHTAGMGNADFLWSWTPGMSADDIVSQMQYAEPAYSMRSSFTYQNIMYLVAGQIVEKISGKPWVEFVEERLFKPLGMNDSYATYNRGKGYPNKSIAHFEIDGKVQAIPEMLADPVAPAGSVWSTSDDIGKWVSFMLGNTTVNGKELIKPETLAEILKPQVIVPKKDFYPTAAITKPNWMTYGLGWFQHDYRGEMINYHTGSLAGRTAIIGLLKDKKVGVYVFGNIDHAEVRHALMYKVFDLFAFNDDSRDWSAEFLPLYDGIKKQGEKALAGFEAARQKNTKPSLSLDAYAGTYQHQFYGNLEIKTEEGKMELILSPEVYGELSHWHYDTFEVRLNKKYYGKGLIAFNLNPVTRVVDSVSYGGVSFARAKNK